jgi:hypothetical protein
MNLRITALIASVLCLSASAHAQTETPDANDPYFQISSVETSVKNMRERNASDAILEQARADFLKQNFSETHELARPEGVDPMAIADILFKVWDIIVANKPIVNIDAKNASALPNLAEAHWERLTGWQRERQITYSVQVKNGFGSTVIDLKYGVKLLYGGGVKGKGRYIASARVVPQTVDVKWGFNLDVNVTVPSIVNMGTEEDPLAAIYLDVNYKIHNILRSDSEGQTYLLQGDGLLMNTKTNEVYYDSVPRP